MFVHIFIYLTFVRIMLAHQQSAWQDFSVLMRIDTSITMVLHDSFHRLAPSFLEREVRAIGWLRVLSTLEQEHALRNLRIFEVPSGNSFFCIGQPATHWCGVMDGLLKMSADNADGQAMTFVGVPPGGWFGEGTVIKREAYRYNIQALRKSRIAGLPVETFHWLLEHSIGFNRFVLTQLNERLGQFIGGREIERISNADIRVARSLAALLNPVLYPGFSTVLNITQQELAYLVGLSRQRVNEALTVLAAYGAIAVEYGGLRVLDLDALRTQTNYRQHCPLGTRRLLSCKC